MNKVDKSEPKKAKDDFCFHMYNQMWTNINRHILTVWHSIAAVAGALSIIIFAEKNPIHIDVAVTLIIILAAWLLSHVYDAQQWYDRNLGIIIRVERRFLPEGFHAYMKPRKRKLIGHLQIQRDLAFVMLVSSVLFHLANRVLPTSSAEATLPLQMLLPYVVGIATVIYVAYRRSEWERGHEKAYLGLESAD